MLGGGLDFGHDWDPPFPVDEVARFVSPGSAGTGGFSGAVVRSIMGVIAT